MRRIVALALLGAALLAPALAAQPQPLDLRGTHGERLTDADLARGVVVVVVWASWSPRGRNIAERVTAMERSWAGKARVVTVNFQEDPPAVQSFLAAQRWQAPTFLDPEGAFAKRYAVATLPGLVVFRDGTPVYKGKLPDDPDAVIAGALR